MKIEDELVQALYSFTKGYEDFSDAGFFDLFCHGEVIQKALEVLRKYEENKQND